MKSTINVTSWTVPDTHLDVNIMDKHRTFVRRTGHLCYVVPYNLFPIKMKCVSCPVFDRKASRMELST